MRYLRRLAIEVLGEEVGRKVWSRMEIVGDILILKKPFNMEVDTLKPLAIELLKRLPYIKSVWCSVSEVYGKYRLRRYVHLAGEERSETIYKEHGCVFKLDITKVYISQRLSREHIRIANQVNSGETIVNMFAGVGTFSIIIAKHARPHRVFSIDINPHAYRYMVENVKLNKVEHIVIPILGDAAKVVEKRLVKVADRVLMPLPELLYKYLKYGVDSLKNRGVLHLYDFVYSAKSEDPIVKSYSLVSKELEKLKVKYKLLYGGIVRSVGPRKYQVVLDIEVFKNPTFSSSF